MMNNTINNNVVTKENIQLRTKFKELMANLSEEQQSQIIDAIVNFANEKGDEDCFLKILWQLTYDAKLGLQTLKLFSEDADTEFSEELVIPLRNELRHQRKKVKDSFMKVEIPQSCKEEYERLLRAVGGDTVVAEKVYITCFKLCIYNSYDSVKRCLELLSDSREECQFGGIRSLHFRKEEAIYLKPYVKEIHDLVLAVSKIECTDAPISTPFEGIKELIGDSIEFETKRKEEPVKENVTQKEAADKKAQVSYKKITLSNIEGDCDALQNFLDAWNAMERSKEVLEKLGYSSGEVLEKAELIRKSLEISKEF